jgi:hypothetical protein
MPSSVKLLWVSGEGEVMVWRGVGQGSDSRRVHMSLGGTADVREMLKKASSSMYPEISGQ